jgi:hypothetical protein
MLILLFVFGLTLISLICAISFGHKRSKLVKVCLLLPCYIPIATWCYLYAPLDLADPQDLRGAYCYEFGIPASADVTNINCRQVVVGDSGISWLRFQASSSTVDSLLRRFRPSNREEFMASTKGAIPEWWNPQATSLVAYYRAEHWRKDFHYSDAFLAHDQAKRLVYFYHDGSD